MTSGSAKRMDFTRPTVAELIAEDDKVVARTILRGAHTGPFMGIAPTGRWVVQEQTTVCALHHTYQRVA